MDVIKRKKIIKYIIRTKSTKKAYLTKQRSVKFKQGFLLREEEEDEILKPQT